MPSSDVTVIRAAGSQVAPETRVRRSSRASYCAPATFARPSGSMISFGSACSYRLCAATDMGVARRSGFMLSSTKPSTARSWAHPYVSAAA